MSGHKPWPPRPMRSVGKLNRDGTVTFYKSMDRQAVQKRRAKWIKEGLWAIAAVVGFVAMLMVGGCSTAPVPDEWCKDSARTKRLQCEATYGPNGGYNYTLGWEEACLTVFQNGLRKCAR